MAAAAQRTIGSCGPKVATVEAEHRSKCPACGEWIEVGDLIEYDEDADAFVHEDCAQGRSGL